MITTSFDSFRKQTNPNSKDNKNSSTKYRQTAKNNALRGVLVDNHIKNYSNPDKNFDTLTRSLLIPEKTPLPVKKDEKQETFDYKKVLKPLVFATGASVAASIAISLCMLSYSKSMAKDALIIRPDDLARNHNILQEDHFALYRALRMPSTRNTLGFIGVAAMSAVTFLAKNLTDGFKDVWIKKQNCDIEHSLQENLIEVETQAFSGKLNIVNAMLKENADYFKSVFEENSKDEVSPSFRGREKKDDVKDDRSKKIAAALSCALGAAGFGALLFMLLKNFHKTLSNLDTFSRRFEDKSIRAQLIKASENPDKEKAINTMKDIFKNINADEEKIKENLSLIKEIDEKEIDEIASDILKEVKNSQIFTKVPEALGGISEKIQYYCYMDEERGHLYNWILNPENKFNKYLFLAFSTLSAVGYLAKTAVEAVRKVGVDRENSKSELNLRKRLVAVEIENFKTKKQSAIEPLLDEFKRQLANGLPKEELKEMAENILIEIKNGPPYVYS